MAVRTIICYKNTHVKQTIPRGYPPSPTQSTGVTGRRA